MNLFYITVLYIFFGATSARRLRITGDIDADIERVPYQAQILQLDVNVCGATIVSKYWLVSAAHCFAYDFGLKVLTGTSHRSKGGVKHDIERVVIHPNYNNVTRINDISLIKLKEPLQFNESQKPISMACARPKTRDVVEISGFGKQGDNRSVSPHLKVAKVLVVDDDKCAKAYDAGYDEKGMFCAGRGMADACQGDSGGPAVINGQLAGIISGGIGCASVLHPGVYIDISEYHGWIVQHVFDI
ncbi:hypothetical protein TKK_0006626 [Trichogramma kaykai]|uniref:Peptidase S1 domain-containing protein n=1 Tax=Trichogramma kaykai TaxID=54128 RepID=A0ABD2XDD2_9HYME